jgi:uncharacterized protein YbaP (TraB family)
MRPAGDFVCVPIRNRGDKIMRKLLLALLVGAATVPAHASSLAPAAPAAPAAQAATPAAPLPDADPALWKVSDADTTIYMFGTMHLLDGKTDWFNEEVKAAFDRSGEVVVEAIVSEDPAALQPIVMKYAVDTSGKTVRSKMDPELRTKYEKVVQELGMPAQALDQFEPWMVNMSLAAAAGVKTGLQPEHGADTVIKRAAKKYGKPVSELEGVDWQMSLFDSMPEADQLRHLKISVEQFPQMKPMLGEMLRAWNAGDVAGLTKVINAGLNEAPDLRKVLLADRNATWAKWVQDRLNKPGVVFMAVGAGHLAGEDSVQEYLNRKGIKAEKVG